MRFKTIGSYSLLAYLNQGCNVIINLVFIRVLPLPLLGEVAIAKVWMQLMDYSHLGFRFALDRYVPVWSKDKSEDLLWLCLGVSTLVSTVIICGALLFTNNPLLLGAFIFWGYCVSIATILKNYYRALGDNRKMLYVYAVSPTVPVATQALTVVFLGFTWFLVLTIAVYGAAVFYLFREKRIWRALGELDWKGTLRSVRSSAFYLLLNAIVVFLSFSVDRIVLDHFAGKSVLGEYSIVLFGFSLLLIVPSTLAEFIFPRVVQHAVSTGKMFFPRELASVLAPTILVVAVSWVAVPYAVNLVTDYGRLTGMIQLITVGILPYAVTPILFHVMSALDMRRELLIAACLTLATYFAILVWGSFYASNLLEFFTVARAGYGYILISAYILFLTMKRTAGP